MRDLALARAANGAFNYGDVAQLKLLLSWRSGKIWGQSCHSFRSASALRGGMAAGYLTSPFQKELLAQLRQISRDREDFFVEAPLVIDCRDDAETFRGQLTDLQRAEIAGAWEAGRLEYVSQLARPAREYARSKVEERRRHLDQAAWREVSSFLDEWRLEVGKRVGQPGKSRRYAFGIDIILPVTGARLSYDISSMVGL